MENDDVTFFSLKFVRREFKRFDGEECSLFFFLVLHKCHIAMIVILE